MEIENTTILSTIVGLAGFLAELIFRDALSGSVPGVIMSVVLALIVLFCAYLALDGLSQSLASVRKKEENRSREYDEKVFRLLNRRLSEIVKFQKATYAVLVKGNAKLTETTAAEDEPDPWTQLAEEIGESTLKAAKLTVKYSQKQQEKSDQLLEQNVGDILQAISGISNRLQEIAGEIEEIKSQPLVADVRMPEGASMVMPGGASGAAEGTSAVIPEGGSVVTAGTSADLPTAEETSEIVDDTYSSDEMEMLKEDIIPSDEDEEEDPLLEALAMEGEQLLAAVAGASEEESEEDVLASLNMVPEQEPDLSSSPDELLKEEGQAEPDLLPSLDELLKEEGQAEPDLLSSLDELLKEEGQAELEEVQNEEETPVVTDVPEESEGSAPEEILDLEEEADILASLDQLLKEEDGSDVSDVSEPAPPKKEEPTAIDLLAQKQKEESVKQEKPTAPSMVQKPDMGSDPNKQLTPEEIAALFAAPEAVSAAAEPAKASTPVKAAEPAKTSTPAKPAEPAKASTPAKAPEPVSSDPNKMMSPDDIAALIASMK